MLNPTFIAVVSLFGICATTITRGEYSSHNTDDGKDNKVRIVPIETYANKEVLEIRYQIKNDSAHDVWLCDDIDAGHDSIERSMDDDRHTLRVRRRLDIPMSRGLKRNQPIGRYSRLRSHESRSESLLLHLPIRQRPVLTGSTSDDFIADRLSLEIGYYSGDLPAMVLDIVKDLLELVPGVHPPYPNNVAQWLGGLKSCIRDNEKLRDRGEHVEVPWSDQTFKGEQVLQVRIDGLHVSYLGEWGWTPPMAPRLSRLTRVEISYQASPLEYFFPYAGQQSLLSPQEKQYLRSQRTTITAEDQAGIGAFADEIAKGFYCEAVQEGSTAHVVCYRDDERMAAFTVYSNTAIETEDRHRFRYSDGLVSLRQLTPQILPFDLRMRCADNLRSLWYRMRFYYNAMNPGEAASLGKDKMAYPGPAEWYDATVFAFQYPYHDSSVTPYRCPAANQGDCNYAMNPNCRFDSPADMVLLFETKGGRNQHGGSELFTFDNHDPKGGLVLLNNGTVEFIRTEEELKQLRWK